MNNAHHQRYICIYVPALSTSTTVANVTLGMKSNVSLNWVMLFII